MSVYTVKEIFYTLQGEGAQMGRAAVFLRFAGCNLWSGLEKDRSSAVCSFCDTDFVGTNPNGGKFTTADDLARQVDRVWRGGSGGKWVVCTGGEPLLQLDAALIAALHALDFKLAVESNGTIGAPSGIDWLCVSPKAGSELQQFQADELKLVYPQEGAMPELFERFACQHFFLQPMDGDERDANTQLAIAYCKKHPQWRLSIQAHKVLNIP
jgi:7-carboxy-7-deazaguanine synthase (Cx14CxxC type)